MSSPEPQPIVSASFVLRFADGIQHTFDIGEGHDITFSLAISPDLSEITPFGNTDRFEPPIGRNIDVCLKVSRHRWDATLTRTVDQEHTLSRANLERLVQLRPTTSWR